MAEAERGHCTVHKRQRLKEDIKKINIATETTNSC